MTSADLGKMMTKHDLMSLASEALEAIANFEDDELDMDSSEEEVDLEEAEEHAMQKSRRASFSAGHAMQTTATPPARSPGSPDHGPPLSPASARRRASSATSGSASNAELEDNAGAVHLKEELEDLAHLDSAFTHLAERFRQ